MDIWTKEKRSEVMSKIRSKNTKPELIPRKFLYSKGLRYRIYYKKLPGKPDILFPKYKTVIFINGCFWHVHVKCKISHIPKTNVDFWKDKIKKNKTRDNINSLKILSLGWNVLTIWECEIKNQNLEKLYNKIIILFNSPTNEKLSLKISLYEQKEKKIIKVTEEIISYNKIYTKNKTILI